MAIFDRIKYDPTDDTELVWKFPSDDITLGSQLIVHETQNAIFRKNGVNVDYFGPGSHTLSTNNLPILGSLIKLPFGGQTPFTAEVWFVNKTPKRDLKWGTTAPIPLIDPKFGIPVSVRAFGQWGVEIKDPLMFVEQMVGARQFAETGQIYEYFRGELIQDISEVISKLIATGAASVFNINASLTHVASEVRKVFNTRLNAYGIELTNLSVDRINLPDEELAKVQEIMLKKMEAEQLGSATITDSYKTIKTFEVLGDAAKNESGGVLPIITQIGLGGALAAGAATQMTPSNSQEQSLEEKLKKLKSLYDNQLINESEYQQKKSKLLEDL
jgi:membrane protease subunit (stomatin/prohibitin family)